MGPPALAGLNVVPSPELPESFAGQGQFADELDERGSSASVPTDSRKPATSRAVASSQC